MINHNNILYSSKYLIIIMIQGKNYQETEAPLNFKSINVTY